MKCPVCEKENKKSKVYPGRMSQTLAGGMENYYDEEDVYHYHQVNALTTSYNCSGGHAWTVEAKSGCPAPDCQFKGFKRVERNYNGS